MPSIKPGSALRLSLKEYFDKGLYSDLRIKESNGHEYAVHRVIVCGQSPVLANAVNPEHGFKEFQTGVINLDHEDPDAVKCILQFMYRGTYTITEDDKAMTQHAHAYALGETYGITELKELAAAQFNKLSSNNWMKADFASAVRTVYESVPDIDKGPIREIIAGFVAKNCIALLDNPKFEAVLDDVGALGKDVLRLLTRIGASKQQKYKCHASRVDYEPHIVYMSIDHQTPAKYTTCSHCGASCSAFQWAQWKVA